MSEAPFHPTAHVYDVTYAHLDYEGHAAHILTEIRSRNPEARTLLDVACGTGRHLEIWQRELAHVEGSDLDPAMLAVARERVPDVPLHEADFAELDLGRTFDAVTCLFSSIGYARTDDGLRRALAAMSKHLAPGGVLVVEPWLAPHMFSAPNVRGLLSEQPDVVVARTSRSRLLADNVSDMEFTYLVTTIEGSQVFTEQHVMGMFTEAQFLAALAGAGLAAEFDPVGTYLGRGLAVGTKPAA